MIQCRLCGLDFSQITTSHLKSWHGISFLDYLEQFPSISTISSELSEKRSQTNSRSAKEVWDGYSSEDREERLEKGICSEVAKEASREVVSGLSREDMQRRLRNSFHSEEARIKTGRASQESWDSLTLKEKEDRLERSIHSEFARETHIKVCNAPEYLERLSRRMEEQWRQPGYRESLSGENHYNWKGGLRGKYGWGWRDVAFFIKIRDNWVCQLCGTRNNLRVHHIDYDTDNWDDSNLITLCDSCNPRVNGDRDYWKTYMEQLLPVRG